MDVDTILYGYRENGNDISNLVRRTLPFVVVTNIYRLDFIRENSIEWDIKLKSFQDSDFNLSVIAVGGKYCYSNLKPDYYYRISGNEHSISKKLLLQFMLIRIFIFLRSNLIGYIMVIYMKMIF